MRLMRGGEAMGTLRFFAISQKERPRFMNQRRTWGTLRNSESLEVWPTIPARPNPLAFVAHEGLFVPTPALAFSTKCAERAKIFKPKLDR
jgi:hypothetical protein